MRTFRDMMEGHQKGLEAVEIEPKSYEMIMVQVCRKLSSPNTQELHPERQCYVISWHPPSA